MYLSKVIKVGLSLSLLALLMPVSLANAEVRGEAVIRDSSPGLSDELSVSLTMPILGAGLSYEGWLVSDDGHTSLSVGELDQGADGSVIHTYISPDGTNLASEYNQFQVTSSGHVLYSDQISEGGLSHLRNLLYSHSGNPVYTSGTHEGVAKGTSVGLRDQADAALTQATNGVGATTVSDVQSHAAHVINIVEGDHGANFVSDTGSSGDGHGLLNYAAAASAEASAATTGDPTDTTFAQYGLTVSASADNVATWSASARDAAINARSAATLDVALAFITNAQTLLSRTVSGYDTDRNGTIGAGEGGASQAQEGAQNMASFEPTVVVEAPTAPDTGDISYGLFAIIALITGAALVTGGGLLLNRNRSAA
jgi:hypothetical protein